MASPLPNENAVDRYVVTDEEFESLQNFDWSSVSHEILNDLEFITKLPSAPVLDYESLGPLLPPKSADAPAKTLFIDLDETLVHTALGGPQSPQEDGIAARHDLSFISDTDGSVQARVYFRPWTSDFLKIISNYYELVLYTASVKLYADIIIDELDGDGWIAHRLYREHCTQYGESEVYFKDLNGTGRCLKDSVVIDNRLISFGLNIANGIFVSSFTGQSNDTELLHLLPILVALSKQDDIRVALAETYKLPTIVQKYRQEINPEVARSLANIGSPRAHRVDETTSLHTHAISTLGSMAGGSKEPSELEGGGPLEYDDDPVSDISTDYDQDEVEQIRSPRIPIAAKARLGRGEEAAEDGAARSLYASAPAGKPSSRKPPVDPHYGEVRGSGRTSALPRAPLETIAPVHHLIDVSREDLLPIVEEIEGRPLIARETSPPESIASSSTRQASYTRHMQALKRISHTRESLTTTSAPPVTATLNLQAERQPSLRRLILPATTPERKRKQVNPFKQRSRVAVTTSRKPVAPKIIY